jgi:hypothetical protein
MDELKGELQALVRGFVRDLDYAKSYPAKVVKQASDGTLELQPENTRLPGMTGVPLRYGMPGVTVKVQPGGRVFVTFEAADPQRPVATLWDPVSVALELTFEAANKIGLGGAPGSAGMEPAALGQALYDLLLEMKAAFDTHTHAVLAAPPPAPGPPIISAPPASSFPSGDVRASKVEVK